MILFHGFFVLIAVLFLGASINMGVAADRLKRAGRNHWVAVAVSAFTGAGALYFAFLIGQSAQPH